MMDFSNPNDFWMYKYDPYKGMSDEEKVKAGCMQAAGIIVGFILALVICLLFGSCTTTKYVQVPVVHNDTTYITKHQRDSIYVHDSVSVKEKGDTLTFHHWHTKYVEKQVHDTTYISKTDSVPVPYPVEVEVEKRLTWWQQTRIHLANIVLYLLGIGAVIWIGKKHIGKLGG